MSHKRCSEWNYDVPYFMSGIVILLSAMFVDKMICKYGKQKIYSQIAI